MKAHNTQITTSSYQEGTRPGQLGQEQSPPAYGMSFADQPMQGVEASGQQRQPAAPAPANRTGLPDKLKAGLEQLSGYAMDDVKVHYNSSKPAQLRALAYAQGTDIYLGPGQERHLPHEAWHVVQQKEGRVPVTVEFNEAPINDEWHLEQEADMMGRRALTNRTFTLSPKVTASGEASKSEVIQRKIIARIRTKTDQTGNRVISAVRLEGRAPTDVPGSSQGDHTVAETLINESVIREIMGMPRKVALNNLMVLARLTLPEEGARELETDFFVKYWQAFDQIEGEDQNTILEEFAQRYIELANKRPGTAFLKAKEMTYGGGGERQAIGLVRGLADKLENNEEIGANDLFHAAQSLLDLIDMKYVEEHEDRYLDITIRAIKHAVLSVLPQLNKGQAVSLIEQLLTGLGQRDKIPMNKMIPFFNAIKKELGLN